MDTDSSKSIEPDGRSIHLSSYKENCLYLFFCNSKKLL